MLAAERLSAYMRRKLGSCGRLLVCLTAVSLSCACVSPRVAAESECADEEALKQRAEPFECSDVSLATPARLAPGEHKKMKVYSRCRKNWSGVLLEQGVMYEFEIRKEETRDWCDKTIPGDEPVGFSRPPQWYLHPLFWWKRSDRPYPEGNWFQLLGSVDNDSQSVFPIETGKPFKSKGTGELHIFVNDAEGYYCNNYGSLWLKISNPEATKQRE